MQSSTAIAFRALVMLVCMISIPLFAIFGRDLPEIVKNLLAGRLVIKVTDSADPARPSGSKLSGSPPGNSPPDPSGSFTDPAPYRAAPTSTAVAQPAGFQAPAESRPISQPANTLREGAPSRSEADRFVSNALRAANGAAVAPTAAEGMSRANPESSGAAAAPGTGSNEEQFHKAEARLRDLGATHYMLETWGSDNNRYRFVCKMAVGGNPEVNRYFQAIEDDPWRAMQAVLQQVETWRAQPQP